MSSLPAILWRALNTLRQIIRELRPTTPLPCTVYTLPGFRIYAPLVGWRERGESWVFLQVDVELLSPAVNGVHAAAVLRPPFPFHGSRFNWTFDGNQSEIYCLLPSINYLKKPLRSLLEEGQFEVEKMCVVPRARYAVLKKRLCSRDGMVIRCWASSLPHVLIDLVRPSRNTGIIANIFYATISNMSFRMNNKVMPSKYYTRGSVHALKSSRPASTTIFPYL